MLVSPATQESQAPRCSKETPEKMAFGRKARRVLPKQAPCLGGVRQSFFLEKIYLLCQRSISSLKYQYYCPQWIAVLNLRFGLENTS